MVKIENTKEIRNFILSFLKKNVFSFVLIVIVFTLLYICLAERGRRIAAEENAKTTERENVRIIKEIERNKKDFQEIQNIISKNDSLFRNEQNKISSLPIDSVLVRLQNRFRAIEADRISTIRNN